LSPAKGFEADVSYWVQAVLPQDMSHLREWSETTLGCVTADRAVADGPNIMAVSRQAGASNGFEMTGTLLIGWR
jgi:hypothetical protein